MTFSISGTSGLTFPDSTTMTSGAQAVKVWANFDSSTGVVRGSYNVSSITISSGEWYVNFTNALSDTNYSAVVSASGPVNNGHCPTWLGNAGSNDTTAFTSTTAVRMSCYNTTNSGLRGNPISVCVAVFR
jgi:hypothetical protein